MIYSYGIPKESNDYQYVLDDVEISSKLNITKKQIYKYREKPFPKLNLINKNISILISNLINFFY